MENREGSSNNTSYFCWALSFFNGVIALGIASLALSTHIDFEHVIFQGLLPAIRVNVKSGRAYDKHVELVEGWQRDYAAQSVWEYCWTNMDLFRNARKDDMIPDASKTVINRDYEGFLAESSKIRKDAKLFPFCKVCVLKVSGDNYDLYEPHLHVP